MRVLVLSDIHGNLVALESVLNAAAGKFDALWCLGDIVGYGPRPNECVEIIRERATACVIGNHDWAALGRPGINVEDFNPHARFAVLWTQAELTSKNRAFLDSLSDEPIQPLVNESVLITHASPREPVWEYILTPSIALENFSEFEQEICLVGHTHKPIIYAWQILEQYPPAETARTKTDVREKDVFPSAQNAGQVGGQAPGQLSGRASGQVAVRDEENEAGTQSAGYPREIENVVSVSAMQPQPGTRVLLRSAYPTRLIINPGSVGQPRDNDTRASFGILDLERNTWYYERVAYPVELTQNQMREAQLPRRLIDRLSFGW